MLLISKVLCKRGRGRVKKEGENRLLNVSLVEKRRKTTTRPCDHSIRFDSTFLERVPRERDVNSLPKP